MRKTRFLSAFALILVLALLFNLAPISANVLSATCTGADPCKACKNCRYCKHCAKDGGKCGVCK